MAKMLNDIKWGARQRLQHIEAMAYYTGIITRSDLARAFGISDAAATKDLKLYNELVPDNLIYRHSVFGFVPGDGFQPQFSDLAPATVLPMIAANLASAVGPYGAELVFGIPAENLPLPQRLPEPAVLAQILRAIKQGNKLRVSYHSLSNHDNSPQRSIEPHSLVNTGLRWHVRAYNEDSFDFRDFVLSRFVDAQMLTEPAESSAQYDEDWSEHINLQLAPHPGLSEQQQASLLIDYPHQDGVIEVQVRRALIAYLLQRLAVDSSADFSLNPNAHQLALVNRDEIEPFAGWALL